MNKAGVKPPEDLGRFIVRLSEASVPTRYPEDIEVLKREYTEAIGRDTVAMTKKVLQWTRQQFEK